MNLLILATGVGFCLYLILKREVVNDKKVFAYSKLTRIIAIVFFIPLACLILFILYYMIAFALGPLL